MMNGELHYKDIHGRVWILRERNGSRHVWTAETLDRGHTPKPDKSHDNMHALLASIDQEQFLTKDIPKQYNDPERIEEIRQEIDRVLPPFDNPRDEDHRE